MAAWHSRLTRLAFTPATMADATSGVRPCGLPSVSHSHSSMPPYTLRQVSKLDASSSASYYYLLVLQYYCLLLVCTSYRVFISNIPELERDNFGDVMCYILVGIPIEITFSSKGLTSCFILFLKHTPVLYFVVIFFSCPSLIFPYN